MLDPNVMVALISSGGVIVAALFSGVFAVIISRLGKIHTLVNSRLTVALEEISTLRHQVSVLRPGDVIAAEAAAVAKARLISSEKQNAKVAAGTS